MRCPFPLAVLFPLVGCDRREAPAEPEPAEAGPLDFIELPGDRLFPEGIAASRDGRLYIGSSETGEILTVAPGASVAEIWLAPDPLAERQVRGLAVDEARDLLWFCAEASQYPPTLEAYDLSNALPVYSFRIPASGSCRDVAVAEDGSAYVTDDVRHRVWRLPSDRGALTVWLSEDEFEELGIAEGTVPSGLAVLGPQIWISLPEQGLVVQFGLTSSSSPRVQAISGSFLGALEGLEVHGDALVAVDGQAGQLLRLPLEDNLLEVQELLPFLDGPTALAVVGDDAWVVEGQLYARDGGNPSLPFRVVRFPLVP